MCGKSLKTSTKLIHHTIERLTTLFLELKRIKTMIPEKRELTSTYKSNYRKLGLVITTTLKIGTINHLTIF